MTEANARFGHRTVTAADVARFGELTGDYSRIHFDHALGRSTPAGRGFAHGLLGASWALGALGRHVPDRLGFRDATAVPRRFAVRFEDVVHFDDPLEFECAPGSVEGGGETATEFVVHGPGGRVPARGTVVVARTEDASALDGKGLDAWCDEAAPTRTSGDPMFAEDVLAFAPRGTLPVRTVTESDVVAFCGMTGERNPLYLDAEFARQGPFGERIAPPMLCFCLAFSAWLEGLLRLPLAGSEASAGHLGDRWRFVAPVAIGDTLRVEHRPLALRRTRSRPDRGVLAFGLRLRNQHDRVVLDGDVDMMFAMGDREGADDERR